MPYYDEDESQIPEGSAKCPACDRIVFDNKIFEPGGQESSDRADGGCTECSRKCVICNTVVPKTSSHSVRYEGKSYCTDCYNEHFHQCSNCGEYRPPEDMIQIPGGNEEFCKDCADNRFAKCAVCARVMEKHEAFKSGDEYCCPSCYGTLRHPAVHDEEFKDMADKMGNVFFNKKERFLDKIDKLVPISIKDFKSKYPSLAQGAQELITFAKGKDLTHELLKAYRKTITYEEFPVQYSSWAGMQRSIDTLPESSVTTSQLVLNIIASNKILEEIRMDGPVLYLFNLINSFSSVSHPYQPNQIGWARLEIDPDKEFILVDEIQSDHASTIHKIKTQNTQDVLEIKDRLKQTFKIGDEEVIAAADKLGSYLKDFPDIAIRTISSFARRNKFKKIYWHTYESGRALKKNTPPRSLYDRTPKEHHFLPSQERPFNLEGKFFEREAKATYKIVKLGRLLSLKYLIY